MLSRQLVILFPRVSQDSDPVPFRLKLWEIWKKYLGNECVSDASQPLVGSCEREEEKTWEKQEFREPPDRQGQL